LAVVDVAGWTNAGGSGAEVNASSATGMAAIYHWVDAGEVSGVAQTYTATGFFGAGSETGYVHAFAVRGVNTSTPIDDFSMLADIALGASHLTPALTGSNLSTGSTVLAGLGRDGASGSGYGTQNPTGWTQLLSTAVNNDRWSGILNTATTTGVGVASASLTPVVADEYISWAIALNKI